MGDFEQDTAVRAAANGSFSCDIRPDWWVVAGPNGKGGYVAAILVRAMSAERGRRGAPPRAHSPSTTSVRPRPGRVESR